MLTTIVAALAMQSSAPADYRNTANWLCRPGREDSCSVNLDTTVIAADGTRTIEKFQRAADPKFDCFYVYPTVSSDPTPNSDLSVDAAEQRVALIQAARFQSVCRVFAPMYRQLTLTALRQLMAGKQVSVDTQMAYADVKAAFADYMQNDNQGRGVVLVGHSQGSRMIFELLKKEFDGKPEAMRPIISAMTIGYNLEVENGKRTGALKTIPICKTADETGCVVSYVSFRDTVPPPAKTRYARTAKANHRVACTHPAAMSGGAALLDAYLPTVTLISEPTAFAWTKSGEPVTTPFVKLPGLIEGECVEKDGASYLEVRVKADPKDPRTDEIPGDTMAGNVRMDDWGLHLIDVSLGHGDLVKLAYRQAKAWAAKR